MREEGLKSLEEARKLGDEQTARMIILQQQLSDLHSREKRLSQVFPTQRIYMKVQNQNIY